MKQLKIGVSIFLSILLITSLSPVAVSADYTYGNDEFLDALNAALHQIVEEGIYDQLYLNWFSGSVVLTDDSTTNTSTTFPARADITEGGTLDTILSNGTIYFGSDTTYPPFESLDDNGNVVGFDADIAAAIATKFSAAYDLTITAVMQTNDWDPIIPDLQSGKFDAILSAMTKTAERDQVIDFTRAYYTSSQGILANADSPSITGIADLNSSDITIAVQSGTTSQLYAVDNLQAATLNVFDSFDLAVADLKAGDADFLLGDLAVLDFYAVENAADGFSVVGNFEEENFGIGVRENTGEPESNSMLPIPTLAVFFAMLALPIMRKLRQ